MGLFNMFSTAPEVAADADELEMNDNAVAPEDAQPPFDAVAVLEAAGVDEAQRAQVAKAQELLGGLPADTEASLKRTIVETALKAFDVSIEAISAAARAETQALEQFIVDGNAATQQDLDEGASRIAELEGEIAEIRKRMQLTEADQKALDGATAAEVARIQPVADFFGGAQVPQEMEQETEQETAQADDAGDSVANLE